MPKEGIENLLRVKQMQFPDQTIDWVYLLDVFANNLTCFSFDSSTFKERLHFLVMCSMSDRMEALAFKVWRNNITNMIHTADYKWRREHNFLIIQRIGAKITHFEAEYPKLKEITTTLELALWKLRMNASQLQKKIKTDELSIRRQCRITCGADVVIRHILPYLITATDEESDSESDANDDDDNESSDSE